MDLQGVGESPMTPTASYYLQLDPTSGRIEIVDSSSIIPGHHNKPLHLSFNSLTSSTSNNANVGVDEHVYEIRDEDYFFSGQFMDTGAGPSLSEIVPTVGVDISELLDKPMPSFGQDESQGFARNQQNQIQIQQQQQQQQSQTFANLSSTFTGGYEEVSTSERDSVQMAIDEAFGIGGLSSILDSEPLYNAEPMPTSLSSSVPTQENLQAQIQIQSHAQVMSLPASNTIVQQQVQVPQFQVVNQYPTAVQNSQIHFSHPHSQQLATGGLYGNQSFQIVNTSNQISLGEFSVLAGSFASSPSPTTGSYQNNNPAPIVSPMVQVQPQNQQPIQFSSHLRNIITGLPPHPSNLPMVSLPVPRQVNLELPSQPPPVNYQQISFTARPSDIPQPAGTLNPTSSNPETVQTQSNFETVQSQSNFETVHTQFTTISKPTSNINYQDNNVIAYDSSASSNQKVLEDERTKKESSNLDIEIKTDTPEDRNQKTLILTDQVERMEESTPVALAKEIVDPPEAITEEIITPMPIRVEKAADVDLPVTNDISKHPTAIEVDKSILIKPPTPTPVKAIITDRSISKDVVSNKSASTAPFNTVYRVVDVSKGFPAMALKVKHEPRQRKIKTVKEKQIRSPEPDCQPMEQDILITSCFSQAKPEMLEVPIDPADIKVEKPDDATIKSEPLEPDDEGDEEIEGSWKPIPDWLSCKVDEDDELLLEFKHCPDESRPFICVFCYSWFQDEEELKEHTLSKHVRREPTEFHSCRICGARFIARILRLRHEKMHKYDLKHPWYTYFDRKHILKYGIKTHFLRRFRPAPLSPDFYAHLSEVFNLVEKLTFDCCDCGVSFSEEEDLRNHYEAFHAVQECALCGILLKNWTALTRHEKEVHGIYKVYNNYAGGAWSIWDGNNCDEAVEKEDILSDIAYFHNYLKPKEEDETPVYEEDFLELTDLCVESPTIKLEKDQFEAPLHITYAKPTQLNQLWKYSNVAKFSPTHEIMEPSEFTNGESDQDQMSSPSPQKGQILERYQSLPFRCPICPKSYDNEHDLKRHSRCHGGEKYRLMCQYCEKYFKTHSHRKEHERTHTGEKPYACPICNRSFIQSSNLKKHIQTHKFQNTLQCSHCGKQFIKESSLVLHQRAHAQDRKFRCEYCDRAYNYASLLKRHMRIHTGETPYVCRICGMLFHELVSLHYHRKKVHTGERPHKCDTCGRGFILSSDLKKHLQIHLKPIVEKPPRVGRKRSQHKSIDSKSSGGADGESVNSEVMKQMEASLVENAMKVLAIVSESNENNTAVEENPAFRSDDSEGVRLLMDKSAIKVYERRGSKTVSVSDGHQTIVQDRFSSSHAINNQEIQSISIIEEGSSGEDAVDLNPETTILFLTTTTEDNNSSNHDANANQVS